MSAVATCERCKRLEKTREQMDDTIKRGLTRNAKLVDEINRLMDLVRSLGGKP